MARLGPSVGIAVISRTPAGMRARSSSRAGTVPVRRYSATFAATDFPTSGIFRNSLSSSRETSSWWPPMARAAFS